MEALVRVILARIAEALADGDRVELRDFGAFSVRDNEARISRNPRTGAKVAVPARTHVHFKPGKAMRARINRGRIKPAEEAERLLCASQSQGASGSAIEYATEYNIIS